MSDRSRSFAELADLRRRTVVVTGGVGHIGRRAARGLAEQGATVALVDLDPTACERAASEASAGTPGASFAVPCDLADEESTRAVAKSVLGETGRIDALVHFAALVSAEPLGGWTTPFEQQSSSVWRRALEINLTSVFVLTQACTPALRSSGHGSVVTVGSTYGIVGPDWRIYDGTDMGNAAGYAASKGGVIQLTRWLATTLAPDVRVNCLSPGGVFRDHPDSFRAAYEARTPLGRMATEEDYVGATVFLVSDLSAYVTGQNLAVDGGWTGVVTPEIEIAGRRIGAVHPPFVIPEIGINHEGDMDKARRMVADAAAAGAEVVKFQSHSPADEMVPNDVVPANTDVSIWDVISRCTLSWDQERELKAHAEALGLTYLSTPFSREAADHLREMDVAAYKIGSGECNNLPLIDHIASFGRPLILSTGMNDLASVARSVEILRRHRTPFALLHCTSLYPTPRTSVRLGALAELRHAFPDAVLGLSDHTLSNHVALGAVALGASVLERHFTSDRSWPGPDIEISMTPDELGDLVVGSRWVHEALGGSKTVLDEEQPTIDFAYASVVTLGPIAAGECFDTANVWVKRPGTGEILAAELDQVLGRRAATDLPGDHQLRRSDVRP